MQLLKSKYFDLSPAEMVIKKVIAYPQLREEPTLEKLIKGHLQYIDLHLNHLDDF